ncbi:hypothetical protein GCM10009547_13060 [Sporichthya brevicatena]|uniref:SnoaL-like domain-containing protein n=1 Tax=Sporichthya brevicatena TaxID=171442 RepID=A0ABN1GIR5_9ACTN
MAEDAGGSAADVVRRFTAAMQTGDIGTCCALLTEDSVFSEAPSLPFGGDWHGSGGFRSFLSAVATHYRVRLTDLRIDPAGGRVLVRVSGTISSRATGRSLPLDAIDVYEVRKGRIARVDVYYKDSAAVAALCEPVAGEEFADTGKVLR